MSSTRMVFKDSTVKWLLSQGHPGIAYFALKELLERSDKDPEVISYRKQIASHPPVAQLLKDQHSNGYWGEPEDVYWPKWKATVWQLILLAEFGLRGDHQVVQRGCEYFLQTMDKQDRSWPPPAEYFAEGDLRGWRSIWEPCVTGNMARTFVTFGLEEDPRVREMFDWLVKTPLPDGGWNCEFGPWGKEVFHSSFMSTIEPLWAFSELPREKWPRGASDVVEKAAEFMLMHRLFKSDKTGKVINEEWTKLHFPLFYFYDILHGLRVLTKLGYSDDERLKDALDLLLSKRLPDGTWPLESTFVRALRQNFVKDPSTGEWAVDKDANVNQSNIYTHGGRVAQIPSIYASLGEVGKPNPWVTLNALRVLKNTS